MTDRFRILWILLALFGFQATHARALSEVETNTLNSCKLGRAQLEAAAALARNLGKDLNTGAAPAVIRSGCETAVVAFSSAFGEARSQHPGLGQSDVESMVLQVIKDPGFFDIDASSQGRQIFLVQLLASQNSPPYQSRELYQRFYDSIKRKLLESPTTMGPNFNGHWSAPDGLLIHSAVPDTERSVAALLPLMYSACQAQYLGRVFQDHHYALAFDPLRALYLRTPLHADACDVQITQYMANLNQGATTDALLMRLHWLFEQPRGEDRDRQLMEAADAFSYVPVATQIEHASLEGEVRDHLQNPWLLHHGQRFFDHMEDIAARSVEFTPANLSYWIAADSVPMVRQSIEHGVDVNADPPLNQAPTARKTALSQAIDTGDLELVKLLVEAGADVNGRWPRSANGAAVSSYDWPPLSYAVCALPKPGSAALDQSTAIVSLLLAHGARVGEANGAGITALHRAAQCAQAATLEVLLAAGADVDGHSAAYPNGGSPTPLHFAAKSHRPENVICLLNHRAQINARSSDGATPLFWAVEAADPAVVKVLLDRGADVNLAAHADMVGEVTPVVLAHELPNRNGVGHDPQGQEIENLLKSRGAFLNPITIAKHKLIAAILLLAAAHGGMN